MKDAMLTVRWLFVMSVHAIFTSCNTNNAVPSKKMIGEIDLKRGNIISCGPADKQFGLVAFDITGNEQVKKDFNFAIALLHSFEYDESEKAFSKIIDEAPGCAMAYWGVAMSNYHPLWAPPSQAELKKGAKAIEIAQSIQKKSKREAAYINAMAAFYQDWEKTDHRTRTIAFEKEMGQLYTGWPQDKEAATFYALALDAAADPADKTFANQKKAGAILTAMYANEPNHPGIAHYIIHTYDYPELAALALPTARKYASIAPSSAHALHMPSHIFTRLGLWDECIQSNLNSVASAKCYAEAAGIKGHWDEELHGLDYLVYSYLQKGDNDNAKTQWDYLNSINEIYPPSFKVAYAFAAIPSRYVLENRQWKEAAGLTILPTNIAWKNFQWQEAILHFARLLGSVHTDRLDSARLELRKLNVIHDSLIAQKDTYKANQVQIQIKTGEAWIQLKQGKKSDALALMTQAADMEDNTEKHPVTPCEVLPARELLGDLLLQMNEPGKALLAYEEDLKKHPKRFNGLYGAGLAAEKTGDKEKAAFYYKQLLTVATNSRRPELASAKSFLKQL
jgi:tetratricopeptide (TPR) repeat protein